MHAAPAGTGHAADGPSDADDETPAERAASQRTHDLRQRLIITTVLGVPVLLMSMIEALQFRNWQWLAVTLTAPVAVWGAWPFHRSAYKNLLQPTAPVGVEGIVAAKPLSPSLEAMRGWLAALEQGLAREDRSVIFGVLHDAVPDFGGEAA